MTKSRGLARRTFLRGALATGSAVALGLPLLDAMTNLGGTAHADETELPKRFVLWWWGNGLIHQDAWSPSGEGRSWTPSAVLRGLDRPLVKPQVSIVSNTMLPTRFEAHRVNSSTPAGNNPHVEGACGILTGGNPVLAAGLDPARDWDFMSTDGPSIDQTMIDVVGARRERSLTLQVGPVGGLSGGGTALRRICHRGPGDYIDPNTSPHALFAQLFSAGLPTTITPPAPEELARARVLDAVREDARALRSRLGATDREHLDSHLTQIEEIEQRLRGDFDTSHVGASCAMPEDPASSDSFRTRNAQFAELVGLAFACDLTRVVSLCFSETGGQSRYPDAFGAAGIRIPGSTSQTDIHDYGHRTIWHGDAPDPQLLTGYSYLIGCYADFVEALATVREGEGSVLDRSVVFGTTEITKSETHDTLNFPLLVAGGGGLGFTPGVHVRAPGGSIATQVPYTILRGLGSTETSWGRDQFRTSTEVAIRT